MVRRLLAFAAILVSLAGCGQSTPTTPQQLVQQGDYDQAIEACTQLLRANPRDSEAYLYRGRAYHCRNAEGDLARAIADFNDSILQDPQNSEAYYSRALAYRDRGEEKLSAADEERARKLDPRVKEVYAQLPEYTPPTSEPKNAKQEPAAPAEAKKETATRAGSLIKPPADELKEYERLKQRFEPDGSIAGGAGGESADPSLELLQKPTFRMPTSEPEEEYEPELAAPLASPAPAAPGGGSSPSGAAPETPGASRTAAPATALPPTSPWRRREAQPVAPVPTQPYGGTTLYPGVAPLPHSPFPQRAPRPTGYVEPASPFPQAQQRVQARPLYNNAPYSPQTVRPFGAYHTDYNP
jgi:hypothetical protein